MCNQTTILEGCPGVMNGNSTVNVVSIPPVSSSATVGVARASASQLSSTATVGVARASASQYAV
jgi:hypothetical protein